MTELTKSLPTGWEAVPLTEVAVLIRGVTYKKEDALAMTCDGYVPLLRATNITGTALTFDALVYVPQSCVSDDQILCEDDVVIASSSGSKEIVGKAGQFFGGAFRGAFGAFCTGIRPHADLYARYLGFYCQSPDYREVISAISAGSNINNIKSSELAVHLIPLPPRPEQSRIVLKLEELLSDLDAGVAELKAAQKKLAQYRQSLLKAAVEGALTVDWRKSQAGATVESGAELLARILRERRARWEARQLVKFKEQGKTPPTHWQAKYPDPVAPGITDLPELPDSWVWASLDMLGEIVSGVAKGTKRDPDAVVREVPYLRVANVQRGFLDLSEVKTILATAKDIADLTLRNGDVLFNEGGDRDKLGRGWVWRDAVANCIHQNHVFRMRPFLPETLPELVSHHGNTFGKQWFQSVGKQTTNLASINMGMLKSFPVPVAPPLEHKVVLDRLIQQLEALDEQEKSVEIGLKRAAAQRKNILQAAFSGQLVPQDKSDEPASVLLERIRTERTARAAETTPRRRSARKTQ